MTYQALYRTYRPKTFDDVVGQDVIVQTLKNAIATNKIAHAYIFSGPRGTGKTSVAKIFSNAVNCEANPSVAPCGKCATCKAIQEEAISDVIEIDAASNNGVDEIRELRDKVKYMPSMGKYKVYIIDEVHMLTIQAFNALLKTLEEPPSHVIFILATTEVNKLPLTILSRCQRFDFRGITIKDIVKRLNEIVVEEKIEITDAALNEIARLAEGGMRDAISLLDQAYSFADGEITLNDIYDVSGSVSKENLLGILRGILDKNVSETFQILNDVIEDGKEIVKIIADLISLLRDILIEKNLAFDVNDKNEDISSLAKDFSNDRLYFYLEVLNETQNSVRWTSHKRAYLELALIKMIDHVALDKIESTEKVEMLMNRVNQLELDLKNVQIKEVIVAKEEPTTKEEKPKEVKNPKVIEPSIAMKPITVKDVNEVLNNGDVNKRETLQKIWPMLKRVKDPSKEVIADLLSNSKVVATSKTTAILVYPSTTECIRMLTHDFKNSALNLLNGKQKYIDDYICLDENSWNELSTEYLNEWKKGNKNPILQERDLNIYSSKDEKWQSETVKTAIDFFGKDLVEQKEE